MKRTISVFIAALLVCSLCCGSALALNMQNPWTDTDAQGLKDFSGLGFHVPEEAENVQYRYLESEGLCEIQFVLNGAQCTYRMEIAEEEADISGAYYDWKNETEIMVGPCSGTRAEAENIVKAAWYDTMPGCLYCLVVEGAPEEMDIAALAESLYVPRMNLSEFFTGMEGVTFYFSSGVGGWFTSMEFLPDGSFTGMFHDSEMGTVGEDYPLGTVYGCLFHGKCSVKEQVDEYLVRIAIDSVELDEGQVAEYIEDGIRFVTSDTVYGLENTEDLLVFLPGMPVSELPEGYLFWAHLPEDPRPEVIDFYGLYNETEESGFVGIILPDSDAA